MKSLLNSTLFSVLFCLSFNLMADQDLRLERSPDSVRRDFLTENKTIESESLKVSGLVELEATYSKDQDQSEASDIVLATGQLNFEKRISNISSSVSPSSFHCFMKRVILN